MKPTVLISAFAFLLLCNCKKEQNSQELPTAAELPSCKLVGKHQEGDYKTYSYEYGSNGKLYKLIEKWNGTDRIWFVFNYNNDKLVSRQQYTHYPNAEEVFIRIDSFVYNDKGFLIEKIELLPGENNKIHLVYKFENDDNGQVISSTTFYPTNDEYWSSHKYFWENGNIIKIEDYSGEFQQLEHEWFLEYDTAFNYEKVIGAFPESPENNTLNMVKKGEAKDYTGLLDLLCNPCETSFLLNDKNLPVSIKHGWDDKPEILEWTCD